MSPLKNDTTVEHLFETIAQLRTADECRAFFEDLCTIAELKEMAQRYETALLLDAGISYQKITAMTGVSTATISRVNRALVYGADGYRSAIDRMKETEKKEAAQ